MEDTMNFRSLVPFQSRELARPETFVFGPLQREIDRLFDDFARGLAPLQGQIQGLPTLMPKMDVSETDKEIEITVEMPGLERKDVDITVEDDVLTVRGEKVETIEGNGAQQAQQGAGQKGEPAKGKAAQGEQKAEQKGQAQGGQGQGQSQSNGDRNKSYHVSERTYGVFLRVLQLPPGIDPSSIEATMSNGVLRIRIPKPANTGAKKIDVKEAA
jgi:HSP20 family protein